MRVPSRPRVRFSVVVVSIRVGGGPPVYGDVRDVLFTAAAAAAGARMQEIKHKSSSLTLHCTMTARVHVPFIT